MEQKDSFFLHRDLSRLLIIIVLLLSPLTFSSEKIPNFQPDCASSIFVPASDNYNVATLRAEKSPAVAWSKERVDPPPILYVFSHIPPVYSSQTSRAPPLCVFCS